MNLSLNIYVAVNKDEDYLSDICKEKGKATATEILYSIVELLYTAIILVIIFVTFHLRLEVRLLNKKQNPSEFD